MFLTEIMRQSGSENADFVALLGRLREGKCTDDDYDVLNSRVLGNIIHSNLEPGHDNWKNAPILVYTLLVHLVRRCHRDLPSAILVVEG